MRWLIPVDRSQGVQSQVGVRLRMLKLRETETTFNSAPSSYRTHVDGFCRWLNNHMKRECFLLYAHLHSPHLQLIQFLKKGTPYQWYYKITVNISSPWKEKRKKTYGLPKLPRGEIPIWNTGIVNALGKKKIAWKSYKQSLIKIIKLCQWDMERIWLHNHLTQAFYWPETSFKRERGVTRLREKWFLMDILGASVKWPLVYISTCGCQAKIGKLVCPRWGMRKWPVAQTVFLGWDRHHSQGVCPSREDQAEGSLELKGWKYLHLQVRKPEMHTYGG